MKPLSDYHGEPPDARGSAVYRDAEADAQNALDDALEASARMFESIVDDPEADPVERYNASERLRAFTEQKARRDRRKRARKGAATPSDRDCDAWNDLRDVVKERVSVPDILQLAGLVVTRTGRSRGRDEYHSACPVCRDGVDRLVSWDGPNGKLWCRRCEWSTDVIGAASLIVGTGNFRDCVRWLAAYAGLAVRDGR